MAKMLPYNQDYHYLQWKKGNAALQARHDLTLDDAIARSRDFLLSLQHPEGYWWGELECNATITAQTVLLYKILGIDDRYPMHKMENYLRRTQRAHGGWDLFHGDGGYLSSTIEAYMALRLLDVPKSDPALQKALKFITSRGGVTKARVFTKICLSLIGCYDWSGVPSMPPWLVLLPSWFPFSIYNTASWARGCVVPLTVVFNYKPVFKVNPQVSFDELYPEGRENANSNIPFAGNWISKLLVGADYALKAMERIGFVPFRQRSMKEAERWMLERQEDSGDYHGAYPAMFYAIVCMKTLGYEVTNPVLHRAILALKPFTVETENECSVQVTLSPVWDTGLVVRALAESGMEPDHPVLQTAGEWLLNKQSIKNGDWAIKAPLGHGGGWAFQFFNRWYPDVDDSVVVAMGLNAIKLQNEDIKNGAIARCVGWIRSMQCTEGGWAAYDKDNNYHWLNSSPFADIKAMIDPNTADVTARVLEMVGRLKRTMGNAAAAANILPPDAIARGLSFIRKHQEKDGCWSARWAVNYIYGTCEALTALSLVAPGSTFREEIERGARWLVQVQNKRGGADHGEYCNNMQNGTYMNGERIRKRGDGGWGETCLSYDGDPAKKGKSEVGSTPSQTAWALQGLLAAGDALGKYEVEAIEQGVQYLIDTQREDGSWHEAQFTGTGFPLHFYLRYHMYAQHFPLSALSRYRARFQAGKLKR